MQPRSAKLLWDIADSARFVLTETTETTICEHESNRLLRLAVERAFEIIGEAARRLATSDPETASRVASLPQIIAFRNVLAHDYDAVIHGRVFGIVRDHLPTLLAQVEALLAEEDSRTGAE